MGARRRRAISRGITRLFVALSVVIAGAAEGAGAGPARQLDFWIDEGVVPAGAPKVEPLQVTMLEDRQFVLSDAGDLLALAVAGHIELEGPRSSVRVVLVDTELHEYLVAEIYPLLAGSRGVAFEALCRETCLLPGVRAHRLRVEIAEARLELDALRMVFADGSLPEDIGARRTRIREAQADEIVARLNRSIAEEGLGWVAGETAWSQQPFDERRRQASGRGVPVAHGFDYYVGGIHTPPGYRPLDEGAGTFPGDRFDWRNRHDADRPGSPYFDGDPGGSGWMTPVRRQACGDCWAHATVGVAEALANLRLNRHVDADLSEQALLSCSGAGTCAGGRVSLAFDHMATDGAVEEACFPYQGVDAPCDARCTQPRLRARAGAYIDVAYELGEAEILDALVRYGPLVFGIRHEWHLVVLVGYGRDPDDGQRLWIVKNSWGEDWGELGYGYLKLSEDEIYAVYGLESADLVLDGRRLAPTCRDADGDGYAAWGFGQARPAGCLTIGGLQDCQDADPTLGPALASGRCEPIAAEADEPLDPVSPRDAGRSGGGGAVASLLSAVAAVEWLRRRTRIEHDRMEG